ncbi:hypothetical protein D3C78_1767780 [compost metagenome]
MPQARVVAKCGAYNGSPANTMSAPNKPISSMAASRPATAAAALDARTAAQNQTALPRMVSCMTQ